MSLTLKAARVNKKLTQENAAKKIGVSKDTLGNWERGKTYPDAEKIKTIEVVYGVRYDEINFLA